MSAAPILVLQMQRMGDLILSFPLLSWLQRRHPGHPVWTVAEPRFFTELCRLAPETVFFPPEAHERMRGTRFHSIVNLSHRPDAAHMAGALEADRRFGAYSQGNATYIGGYWSLYRASIVHNNRHNLFHWSDLQLLDHVEEGVIPQLPACTAGTTQRDRVGIFVGASEKEKRPDPLFFGTLARALLRKGIKPLFLGGPDDIPLGEAARLAAGMPGGNMCGRLSVAELAKVLAGLALCVTPDTGPMHLAAWVGTPVLNLSMGTVQAWETGPATPGHHVLRPRLSCAGCWRCTSGGARCHGPFHAGRVALVVQSLLHKPEQLSRLHLPGLELCRSARDARGLYQLESLNGTAPTTRLLLARFWREWFWEGARQHPRVCGRPQLQALAAAAPRMPERLHRATLRLGKEISRHLARQSCPCRLPDAFWSGLPPLIRPLAGHMHLHLQNEEYRPAAWERAVSDVERLAALLHELC